MSTRKCQHAAVRVESNAHKFCLEVSYLFDKLFSVWGPLICATVLAPVSLPIGYVQLFFILYVQQKIWGNQIKTSFLGVPIISCPVLSNKKLSLCCSCQLMRWEAKAFFWHFSWEKRWMKPVETVAQKANMLFSCINEMKMRTCL